MLKLPVSLENSKEWTLVGPMGPQIPEELITHPVLCVDGGADFCEHLDVWVGDGDSHQKIIKCENIFRFPPQKDSSDFALALSLFTTSGPVTLHCWGFLGGRKDHEILNYGAVLRFLEKSPASQVNFYLPDHKVAVKCVAQGEWKLNHSGLFSLASIKNIPIKLLGKCLYKLEQETVLEPLSSLGLSNEAQGEFTLITQGPVMIFFQENS